MKRWYYADDVLERECGCVEKAWGAEAEVYRCEFCKTLYLPNPEDSSGVNVAGVGQLSVFGITVEPKEEKKARPQRLNSLPKNPEIRQEREGHEFHSCRKSSQINSGF